MVKMAVYTAYEAATYQILNQFYKLFIQNRESSHLHFFYEGTRFYMIINLGKNAVDYPVIVIKWKNNMNKKLRKLSDTTRSR